ncbi:unnamed protein product [Enterobius vermicularis]|uniref:GOLGA2L5 domain-containing protein n=1 Tax=Enterobius vermicularis TaxID=51028 RepID=A0A0N4VF67_ENTVE|nr:unnamed protein product [Enterobius vermicularis]
MSQRLSNYFGGFQVPGDQEEGRVATATDKVSRSQPATRPLPEMMQQGDVQCRPQAEEVEGQCVFLEYAKLHLQRLEQQLETKEAGVSHQSKPSQVAEKEVADWERLPKPGIPEKMNANPTKLREKNR